MESQHVIENKRERERLIKLVNEISDKELELVIYKEGWTIAVVLAHLAFWDERRRILVKRWQQDGTTPLGMNHLDTNITNDTLVPFLLAIPVRKAAELAVSAAEAIDKELEELSPEMVKSIEALKESIALNRGRHRKMHLDEIDIFLAKQSGGK
ncbi:MAG: DinB family protein [Dehalococcoidales bacterium]